MKLPELITEPSRALVYGARAAVEVRCPRPGVLRVRHAPASAEMSATHPELPAKRSFAVVGDQSLPLEVHRTEDTLSVTGAGDVTLEIDLHTGGWVFGDVHGGARRELSRCEGATGEVFPAIPIDRYCAQLVLEAPPGEAYLGFGEKVGPLDKRGMRLVYWNTDAFPPNPDTDPLYVSIPFFIALRGGVAWGFFLDEPWRSEVDVARADPARLTWESTGPELDVHLIAGPRPADVVRRYAELTGLPAMPPLWALGAHQSRWGYETESEVRAIVRGYRSRGLPLDAIYLDIDHLDGYKAFTWDRSRFPDPAALARDLLADGVRLVTIVDPGIKAEPGYALYDKAKALDALVRLDRGETLIGEVWPDPAVFPDLTRDSVQELWAEQHKSLVEAGVAGVWNDMNEPACFSIRPAQGLPSPEGGRVSGVGTVAGTTLPYEARHGARRHIEVHNAYALGMARAAFEGFTKYAPGRRPFVLTRAAYAGIQRYAGIWTGDFGSSFTHLEASLPMLVGLGLSGVPFAGADIPGFVGRPTGELLVRWMQAGAFYPLMRNHAARGTPAQEPWRFGEPYLALARAALEMRYRLLPTLYTLLREAADTGLPLLRPLAFSAPEEEAALRAFDQFTVGDDLLVAPVVRPGQCKRLAYLPPGGWLPFQNVAAASGDAVMEGGRYVIADAPLDVVPAWLRAGGAVALTDPARHTTSASWGELTWHVHAAREVRGRLFEDEGDGAGPERWTELRGGLDNGVFRLERAARGALPMARAAETLWIYGLTPPSRVTGARAHRLSGGAVVCELAADWDALEIQL